ncbi:hypothetical protein [Paraburkholderia caribensis]|uniref:hypothetical protein n=1 Tax=Paraburkholderia caribensis TaxID=75105 RepID=UPI0031D1B632
MEQPSRSATDTMMVGGRELKPSVLEQLRHLQMLLESSTNAIPEARPETFGCRKNGRPTSSMSSHEQHAIRLAFRLLLEFYDSPSFSCYAPLDIAVAERWMSEDHEHIIDELERAGALEGFRRDLATYCQKLSAAGALANEFVSGTPDDENVETDTELFFPGVREQIENRKIEQLYELPTLVAILADRLTCRTSYLHNQESLTPPHSRHRPMRWALCDIEKATAGPKDVAYLVQIKDAPSLLVRYTREPYILVVNAQPGTTVRSLTRGTFYGYEDIEIGPGRYQRHLTFSKGMLAIAALPNEEALLLFRRYLPVIYLLHNEVRVVEYEWNPVAYGRSVLEKARAFDNVCGSDAATVYPGRGMPHPHRMLISKVRPMPMRPHADAKGFSSDGPSEDVGWF